jgi:hypothetical protein
LSNNPETREAIVLYAELRIRSKFIKKDTKKLDELLEEQSLVSSDNTISSQWVRVQELRLQALINYKILSEYMEPFFKAKFTVCEDCGSILDSWRMELFAAYGSLDERGLQGIHGAPMTAEQEAEFLKRIEENYHFASSAVIKKLFAFRRNLSGLVLTGDDIEMIEQFLDLVSCSVHCLNHIIEVLQTYGSDYPAGHCFTADIYRHHAIWMQYYYLALVFEDIYSNRFERRKQNPMQKEVESMIGRETLRTTVPMALFQSANYYYHRTLDMHRAGNIYKQYLQNQNFLEDDFNDSLSYFSAALERQRINSGNVRRNIAQIDAITSRSQLFKYRSYVNERKIEKEPPPAPDPKRSLSDMIKNIRKWFTRNRKRQGAVASGQEGSGQAAADNNDQAGSEQLN